MENELVMYHIHLLNKIFFSYPSVFSFVWFYGILTIVGHLMTNPVYTYILDI